MLHFGKIPKKFSYIWRKFSKILANKPLAAPAGAASKGLK